MLLKRRLFAAEKSFFSRKKAISIAFLDTGISPVADFTQPENRIVAFLDLVNGKTEPYDDNGHGTHVTGLKNHQPQIYENKKAHSDSQAIGLGFCYFLWFSTLYIRLQTA